MIDLSSDLTLGQISDRAVEFCKLFRDGAIQKHYWMAQMNQIHYVLCDGDPFVSAIAFAPCFELLPDDIWDEWYGTDSNLLPSLEFPDQLSLFNLDDIQ